MNKNRRKIFIYIILASMVIILFAVTLSSGGTKIREQATSTSTVFSSQTELIDEFFQSGIEGTITTVQQQELERLLADSITKPWLRIDNGVTRFMVIRYSIPDSDAVTPEEKAKLFIHEYKLLFDFDDPLNNLVLVNLIPNSDGSVQVVFTQKINDIPVYGSNITVTISATGEITSINGGYIPGRVDYQQPTITLQQSVTQILKEFGIDSINVSPDSGLTYYDDVVFGESESKPVLTWKVIILDDDGNDLNQVFIDASSGEVIFETPKVIFYKFDVYDNQQRSYTNLSQAIHMMDSNGCIKGQTCDQDAQDAHSYIREYEEFIWGSYRPAGFETDSEAIKAYTHISIPMNLLCLNLGGGSNAFWDNERQVISFTDGMSHGNDIVFHELTHRLISESLYRNNPTGQCDGLCYHGQSGALSESFSDVFGILIDNGNEKNSWRSDDWQISDWSIGEDSPLGVIRNISLTPPLYQSVKKPSCLNDYGYVHQNSLIPSKAAHLLLQNGVENYSNIEVVGLGPRKVSQIYYRAITSHVNENDNFTDARDAIMLSCVELIGKFSITKDDCSHVANAFAAIGIGKPSSSNPPPTIYPTPSSTLSFAGVSSTVLVFDTSGSMNDPDSSGQAKIDAARRAGAQILNIITAENSALGSTNQVGIAGFSTTPYVVSDLTSDISSLLPQLNALVPTERTGMPDGLKTGMDLFPNSQDRKILILLSDGLPNIGLNTSFNLDIPAIQQQVIDLAAQAGQNGICIYTVGFGDPAAGSGSIDEGFLREVASASGCGDYYNAINSIELANVYVELRHVSTGNIVFKQSGQISQGQQLDLGQVEIPANQEMLLLTLNWPGSRLQAVIKDPSGQLVDANYKGAVISESSTLMSIILENPKVGSWSLGVVGVEVPEGTTVYNTIVSTRAGAAITPPTGSGAMPIVIIFILLAGSAVGVYVYSNSIKRAGKRAIVGTGAGGRLIGSGGEFTNQTFMLRDGLLIGRGSGSDIRVTDPSVSRWHARIRFAQGAWFIQDQGSKGGTYVNGQRVNAARLNNGDTIRVGNSTFKFFDEGK